MGLEAEWGEQCLMEAAPRQGSGLSFEPPGQPVFSLPWDGYALWCAYVFTHPHLPLDRKLSKDGS